MRSDVIVLGGEFVLDVANPLAESLLQLKFIYNCTYVLAKVIERGKCIEINLKL